MFLGHYYNPSGPIRSQSRDRVLIRVDVVRKHGTFHYIRVEDP